MEESADGESPAPVDELKLAGEEEKARLRELAAGVQRPEGADKG